LKGGVSAGCTSRIVPIKSCSLFTVSYEDLALYAELGVSGSGFKVGKRLPIMSLVRHVGYSFTTLTPTSPLEGEELFGIQEGTGCSSASPCMSRTGKSYVLIWSSNCFYLLLLCFTVP